MSIIWRLEEAMRESNIDNSSQLQRIIQKKLGIIISRQSLYRLIMQEPSHIKLQTLQILCNILNVESGKIMTIMPDIEPVSMDIPRRIYRVGNNYNIPNLKANPLEYL